MPTGLGDEYGWWCPTLDSESDGLTNLVGGADATLKTAGKFGVVADTGSGGTEAWEGDGSVSSGINTGVTPVVNNSFSMSCWFNQDVGSTGYRTIMAVEDPATRDYLQCRTNNGVMETSFNGFAPIGTTDLRGGWHHVAITWDSNSNVAKQYIDGVLTDSGSMTSGWNQNLGEWEIGSQGRSAANVWDGLLDDARIYNRVLTQAKITRLASARGVEGPEPPTKINLRRWLGYVTDVDGFVPCVYTDAADRNFVYDSSQGFGWDTAFDGSRDRGTSGEPSLQGMHFTNSLSRYFRVDLPSGAGTYKLYAVACDQEGAATVNWGFHDGTTSSSFFDWSGATADGSESLDIAGNNVSVASWTVAGNGYVEHTFTQDHLIVKPIVTGVRISAIWLEESGGTPPATGFYNPFINKRFNNDYTRRIR